MVDWKIIIFAIVIYYVVSTTMIVPTKPEKEPGFVLRGNLNLQPQPWIRTINPTLANEKPLSY